MHGRSDRAVRDADRSPQDVDRQAPNVPEFTFPVGYHALHRNKLINYQLNRWHSLGYARLEDLEEAAPRIRTLEGFGPEMLRQASRAQEQGRHLNEAFYLRAAEFFVPPEDPEKRRLYARFTDRFYGRVARAHPVERSEVPYAGGALPALLVPSGASDNESRRVRPAPTLLIHGGFDSFMEEFYSIAWFFAGAGFRVILFDGPGQGGALNRHGLHWNHEWEGPTAAVLDHFGCEEATLLGISMGAWLCIRAAAFEPRIARVVAMGVGYDYLAGAPRPLAALVRLLFRFPRLTDAVSRLQARVSQQERWALQNLIHVTGKTTPTEAAGAILAMNAENLHSDRVRQDVLVLAGAEDHFGAFGMHLKLHRLQVEALTGARSVTDRIFTRKEQAQNHCQVGNIGLALGVIREWIGEVS